MPPIPCRDGRAIFKDGAGHFRDVQRQGAGSFFGDASIEPLEVFPVSFRALCVPGSHLSGDAFSGLVGGPEQEHRPVYLRARSSVSVEDGALSMSWSCGECCCGSMARPLTSASSFPVGPSSNFPAIDWTGCVAGCNRSHTVAVGSFNLSKSN